MVLSCDSELSGFTSDGMLWHEELDRVFNMFKRCSCVWVFPELRTFISCLPWDHFTLSPGFSAPAGLTLRGPTRGGLGLNPVQVEGPAGPRLCRLRHVHQYFPEFRWKGILKTYEPKLVIIFIIISLLLLLFHFVSPSPPLPLFPSGCALSLYKAPEHYQSITARSMCLIKKV